MRFRIIVVGLLGLLLSSCDSIPTGMGFHKLSATYELTPDEQAEVSRSVRTRLNYGDKPASLELKAWGTTTGTVDVCGIVDLGTFFFGRLYRENDGARFEVERTADAVSTAPGLSSDNLAPCRA